MCLSLCLCLCYCLYLCLCLSTLSLSVFVPLWVYASFSLSFCLSLSLCFSLSVSLSFFHIFFYKKLIFPTPAQGSGVALRRVKCGMFLMPTLQLASIGGATLFVVRTLLVYSKILYSTYLLGDPEITANLYGNFAYPYWEGCMICSIYLRYLVGHPVL